MKHSRNYFAMGVCAALVLLAGCGGAKPAATPAAGGSPAPAGGGQSATAGGEIKIGYIGALSGTNAVLGKWDTQGIELAIDEWNAKGGIKGKKIVLVKYDDEADPTKAVNAAQRLVSEDKVVAAFATTNSTSTIAVVPIFQRAKVVHFTGSLSEEITNKGSKYVFRNTASGRVYENTLIDYLVKKGFKKFAQITDSGAYGRGQAQYQQEALAKHGLKPLLTEVYNPEDKDFTGQLTKILKTDAEVLLFGGSEVASGLIAKQARQLGFKGQLAGGSAIGTPKFIEVAGDAAEGTIFASAYITNDLNDATRAFNERFKKKYGEEAVLHNVKAYDGANMLFRAMNEAPELTGDAIADQIRKIKDYVGLQGKFQYDERGEGIAQAMVGRIVQGKLTPIKE